MQINNSGITSNTNASGKQMSQEANNDMATQDSSAPVSKDSVELSREAQTLKRLEAQIMATPDVDLARVASIRQAISEGTYQIDAEAIAAKMLQSDSDF